MSAELAARINIGFYRESIEKERKARGFTKKELARLVGVDPSQVTRWSQGGTVPQGDTLLKLSLLFGKNPYHFFTMGTEFPGTDLRGGLGALLESSVGEEEGRVVALMRWLTREDKAKLVERALALAEAARPDLEHDDLLMTRTTSHRIDEASKKK